MNPYDEVAYPHYLHPQTHPDRLATMARLHGLHTAPVERCRVLELGCGSGASLIPFAFGLPGSEFVGIDLAERPIAAGRQTVEALGLRNVELRRLDIMDLAVDIGSFDYVIAYGLYSWVPPAVRDRIVALCGACLAPNGVAFVSYAAYPGGHLSAMVREMMRYHTRGMTDPHQQARQARGLLRFVREALPDDSMYEAFLGAHLQEVLGRSEEHLIHDELAEINDPVYFHQFVAHAERHGLQYLAEADPRPFQEHALPPSVRETLDSLESVVEREQYLDFIHCRRFRRTLLCRREIEVDHRVAPDRVRDLLVASSAQPTAPRPDLGPGAIEEFRAPDGSTAKTDHPLTKAALLHLGEIWPRETDVAGLFAAARARLGDDGHGGSASIEDEASVVETLPQLFGGGLVRLHTYAPRLTPVPGERPTASPIARFQVRHGAIVTTLRHDMVALDHDLARYVLPLLDGTRDRAALLAALTAWVESDAGASDPGRTGGPAGALGSGTPDGQPSASGPRDLAAELEQILARFGRLALLLA